MTRSVPSPPTRASERSTLETSIGRLGDLENDVRERLVHRQDAGAVAAGAPRAQMLGERLAERAAGGDARRPPSPGASATTRSKRPYSASSAEQVVEHREARVDVRPAASAGSDLHA